MRTTQPRKRETENKERETRNVVAVTTTVPWHPWTFQTEPISNLKAFRVMSLSLNLDDLSTAIPFGVGLPNKIAVHSSMFSSLSGNSYSYIDGQRRDVIAVYPVHLGRFRSFGGRTTWEFKNRQKMTYITSSSAQNINRYDFSVFLDNVAILLGPTDRYTVILETMCEIPGIKD